MNEYLWQKFRLYDWDNQTDNYIFSFDKVSCKTAKDAMRANPNYIAIKV